MRHTPAFLLVQLVVGQLVGIFCGILGGTTEAVKPQPKTLIVNTVSVSFWGIHATITPQPRAT
jgi:hypothetical protein